MMQPRLVSGLGIDIMETNFEAGGIKGDYRFGPLKCQT
jgi:hypothetical protein